MRTLKPLLALAAAVLAATTTLAAAEPAASPATVAAPAPAPAPAAAAATPVAGTANTRTLSLRDLGMLYSLKLRTVFGQASLPLNLRSDQIVTSANLELRYAHSPSLRFDLSHLSVYVNDQLLRTIPLSAESASGAIAQIPIDPRLLLPNNQIRFELVAHYAKPNECEDPAHTTLWADVSNESRITLNFASLPQTPKLENLPAPLFDAGDERRVQLPFVFAGNPDTTTLKAAAVVAGWFGAQSAYRGADFPVSFGPLPDSHAVLFVIGSGPWPGLERLGARHEPSVSVIENPTSPGHELLVFSAADADGLVTAAEALALGKLTLRGSEATIGDLQLPAPRVPWVGPQWIDPSQPFRLADGAIGPMTVTGLMPGPIGFEFSLPPDLYPLSDSSVLVKLKYRAAPVSAVSSSLNVLFNEQFIGGVSLDRQNGAKVVDRSSTLKLTVPFGLLRAHNRLDAQYHFRRDTNSACQDFDVTALQGAVDPESTVEIRHYAHFAEMPALEKFAAGGYPYSRLSDLGETTVVLPAAAVEEEVSAALIAIGHLGRWTRDAATRVNITTTDGLASLKDQDVLLVGRLDRLGLPEDWNTRMPLRLNGQQVELAPIGTLRAFNERWLRGHDVAAAREHASRVLVDAGQRFAAIEGFESPQQRGRSVVLLTAGRDGDVRDAALALTDAGTSQFIHGALAIMQGGKLSGYELGVHYDVGHLPWWFALRRWFNLHPYLIWPMALLLVIILGFVVMGLMRRRAAQRLAHKI